MRVLVCGGRDFRDRDYAFSVLDQINKGPLRLSRIQCIIHGGCNGADYIASRWAETRSVEHWEFRADWKVHGRAAGPTRNQRMINEGRPDLVIAFPGGRGTADMLRRARAASIEVREITGKGTSDA